MSRPTPPRNDKFEDYIPVAERIEKFYERFPAGRIMTQIVEHDRESGFVLIRAEVYRTSEDAIPAATGHAYEYKDAGYVQRNSYIEVAETSAVGRSLAFLNFETKRGIASREEIQKFTNAPLEAPSPAPVPHEADDPTATEAQKEEMLSLLEGLRPADRKAQRKLLTELTGKQSRDDLTKHEASSFIEALKKQSP
ncbi:MAG: hypothetical protein ACR2G4_16390 [Pyrinomonadaceae bacterium]